MSFDSDWPLWPVKIPGGFKEDSVHSKFNLKLQAAQAAAACNSVVTEDLPPIFGVADSVCISSNAEV